VKLNSDHFKISENEETCNLETFLTSLKLDVNKCNVFLNIRDVNREEIGNIRDAIVMEVASI
jgi:hypothetical protein